SAYYHLMKLSIAQSHSGGSNQKGDFGDGVALLRVKRNNPEFAELRKSGLTGQADLNHGTSEERGSLLDGLRSSGPSRAELRKNRDDGRGNKQQDEPKITSGTFALTGDSAHNHAVVYWSGQNSSVILILTKLYDFHIGSVTESTLWRSSDSGSTYEKMNDKVGSKTVLSYLYVCPTNKRKVRCCMFF
uniref:Sortilin N-terminal domain-containing protein n=1 Tax=Hippocampus comes TaxID=109280 RepID=A0A3Q3DQF0_HIPCM